MSNLTGRPIYLKGAKRKRVTRPTVAQLKWWQKLREMGCILCGGPASVHHCETGGGGRKDHDKVLPLCHTHHQGEQGIHKLSRPVWEDIYGKEQELMDKLKRLVGE